MQLQITATHVFNLLCSISVLTTRACSGGTRRLAHRAAYFSANVVQLVAV